MIIGRLVDYEDFLLLGFSINIKSRIKLLREHGEKTGAMPFRLLVSSGLIAI